MDTLIPPTITNLRPPRSRKDRPCDACRRRKHSCLIAVRGQPCRYCKRQNVQCTFDMPSRGKARSSGGGDSHQTLELRGGRVRGETVLPLPGSSTGVDTPNAARETRRSLQKSRDREKPQSILRMISLAELSEKDAEDTDEWHDSLDMATNDLEESHFLGSSAMQDLTLLNGTGAQQSSSSASVPTASPNNPIRQVSKDPKTHVFFVRNPAFVYGKKADLSQTIFERVCVMLGEGIPEILMQSFMQRSLPAFPILNSARLLAACGGTQPETGPLPHALLCGILGHALEYEPQVGHLFKTVWKEVVAAEDEEYKQPRLQSLQLAIISLTTRPSQAHAVNAMSRARAVAIAHMIGLHIDCSDWELPRWERSVRKRVWWALFVLDKWMSMVHGRPALINKPNRSVSLPTISDIDRDHSSGSASWDTLTQHSMISFIAQCEIALIIEHLLDSFYSQESQRRSNATATGAGREELRDLSEKLDGMQARLAECLVWCPGQKTGMGDGEEKGEVATGIRCFQLTFLGVRVLLARLHITQTQTQAQTRDLQAEMVLIDVALTICEEFVIFLEELDPDVDYVSFWLPHCSFLLSTTLGLLLRITILLRPATVPVPAFKDAAKHAQYSILSSQLIHRLVHNLRIARDKHKWEVAGTAMIRIDELLKSSGTILSGINDGVEDEDRNKEGNGPDGQTGGWMSFDFGSSSDFNGPLDQRGDTSTLPMFMGDWAWDMDLGDVANGGFMAMSGAMM